jgi:hypothetical protein
MPVKPNTEAPVARGRAVPRDDADIARFSAVSREDRDEARRLWRDVVSNRHMDLIDARPRDE